MRVSTVAFGLVALCFVAQVMAAPVTSGSITSTINEADAILADIAAAELRFKAIAARTARDAADLTAVWLTIAAVLIFLMQVGLTMYEAGLVRPVSQSSVYFKTIMSASVATIMWWFCGWALSFGDYKGSGTRNGFIGNGDFFLVSNGVSFNNDSYARVFFEWTYALIPTTIVTMAAAERLKPAGILILSAVMSGFLYPVVAHWVWSDAGFMSVYAQEMSVMGTHGIYDYGGSGVLFLLAGTAGLAVSIAVGARTDRFEKPELYCARNKVLLVVGTFFIWLCYLVAAAGRTKHLLGPGGAGTASKIFINGVLGGAGGFLGGFPLCYLGMSAKNVDVATMTDSIFAGIAGVASGIALVEPWAALTIGGIAGVIFFVFRGLMLAIKVDDTANTFAAFAMPGFWGLLATALLATKANVYRSYEIDNGHYGLFYEGNAEILWVNFVGAVIIMFWGFGATFIVVKPLAAFGLLRVSVDDEKFGIDLAVYTELQALDAPLDVERDAWSAKLKPASDSEEQKQE